MLAASLLAHGAADAAVIRLRASVSTNGSVVRLGDIADITQAEPDEATKLAGIIVAPAPPAGSEAQIDVASLRSRLSAQGINLAKTELAGSSVVVVTSADIPAETSDRRITSERMRASQEQRAEKLLSEAVSRYLQRIAPEIGRSHVAVSIRPDDVPILLAGNVAGFEILGGAPPWNAPQRLTVRTLDRSNAIREVSVEARVLPQPFVLAVRQTVSKGQVLQAGDLVWRQTESLDGAFVRTEELVGREAQRTIRENEIVRQADVRVVPLVRANDIVTATARVGGIHVKRQMKARNDGAPGDTVTLVALTGRETVVARVTGYHEAEVIPAGGPSPDVVQDDAGQIRFERAEESPAGPSPRWTQPRLRKPQPLRVPLPRNAGNGVAGVERSKPPAPSASLGAP